MAENWVRTDEAEDVAGSIRHALRTRQFVSDDPQAWKWVLLALHSALQGACVCHLTTSAAPVGAVTKKNAREWLLYFEESRENADATPPKTHLMALPDLLKAARMPRSAGDGTNGVGIAISESELAWLLRLHEEVRNQFVHFAPMGWSIEVSGIQSVAILVGRIISEMLDVGYAFRHLTPSSREDIRRNLQALASGGWPA